MLYYNILYYIILPYIKLCIIVSILTLGTSFPKSNKQAKKIRDTPHPHPPRPITTGQKKYSKYPLSAFLWLKDDNDISDESDSSKVKGLPPVIAAASR